MKELTQKHCIPCRGGIPPMKKEEVEKYLSKVNAGLKSNQLWTTDGRKIWKQFKFKDFREAMAFINKVAEIANAEDHHPDFCNYYNKVKITLSTHKISGLHENDFIMAAKIEEIK